MTMRTLLWLIPSMRTALWLVPALLATVVFGCVLGLAGPCFPKFYEEKMRASLFTAFFTLSGFLLSAKTFIVLNLKKEVYATDAYLGRVLRVRGVEPQGKLEVYGPLRRVGNVLLINVSLCIGTSALQFTLGLFPYPWTVAACLASAAAAGGMLVLSLIIISGSLNDMYVHFEEEAKEKIDKMPPPPPTQEKYTRV